MPQLYMSFVRANLFLFTEHNQMQSIGLCSIEFGCRTQSNGLSSIGFDLFNRVRLVWKSNSHKIDHFTVV